MAAQLQQGFSWPDPFGIHSVRGFDQCRACTGVQPALCQAGNEEASNNGHKCPCSDPAAIIWMKVAVHSDRHFVHMLQTYRRAESNISHDVLSHLLSCRACQPACIPSAWAYEPHLQLPQQMSSVAIHLACWATKSTPVFFLQASSRVLNATFMKLLQNGRAFAAKVQQPTASQMHPASVSSDLVPMTSRLFLVAVRPTVSCGGVSSSLPSHSLNSSTCRNLRKHVPANSASPRTAAHITVSSRKLRHGQQGAWQRATCRRYGC